MFCSHAIYEAMIQRTTIQINSFNFCIHFSSQSDDEKEFWKIAELNLENPPFNKKPIQAVIFFQKTFVYFAVCKAKYVFGDFLVHIRCFVAMKQTLQQIDKPFSFCRRIKSIKLHANCVIFISGQRRSKQWHTISGKSY